MNVQERGALIALLPILRPGRVEVTEGDDPCWNWTAAGPGYPVVKIKGRVTPIHRLIAAVWELDLSDGRVARHRCENRLCIRGTHLVAMTFGDHSRLHNRLRRERQAAA